MEAFRCLETGEHGEGIREVGGRGRGVGRSAHHLVVVAVGDVGLLEKGAEGCLELPVGRLQQLLRLVGRTARRQHELVDHDLVFELVHVHGHGAVAQPAPASLRARLTRPPLASRPRLIQIFTVRSDSPRLAARRPAEHAGMCSPRRPRRTDRGGARTPSPWSISAGRGAPAPGGKAKSGTGDRSTDVQRHGTPEVLQPAVLSSTLLAGASLGDVPQALAPHHCPRLQGSRKF